MKGNSFPKLKSCILERSDIWNMTLLCVISKNKNKMELVSPEIMPEDVVFRTEVGLKSVTKASAGILQGLLQMW